jgi:hypothetical protein
MSIRFLHFAYPGGGTVAYDVEGPYVNVAYAFCNASDQFNRRKGRQIATGRYKLAFEEGSTRPCVNKATRFRYNPTRPLVEQVAEATRPHMQEFPDVVTF